MNLTVEPSKEEARYLQARATLIAYLLHKVDAGDFHGVSDAANDLRVMEAEHSAHILARAL